jgi:hypothetical protein
MLEIFGTNPNTYKNPEKNVNIDIIQLIRLFQYTQIRGKGMYIELQ